MQALDHDLKDKARRLQDWEKAHGVQEIFALPDLDVENIQEALSLVQDVARAEVDRETNLNARATAVAGVASVIVALSGAVARTLFETETWVDWTKVAAVGLFGLALFSLTLSISFTVLNVLRPTRGARTKHFLGATVVDLGAQAGPGKLLQADPTRVQLLRFDRAIRTVPAWHVRNRRKARWLRRAWVFLDIGVVAIAVASVFVVAHTLDIVHHGDLATKINEWWILGYIGALGLLAALAVGTDVIRAGRPVPEDDKEIELIALLLGDHPVATARTATPPPVRG
ncbi:MAG TPA: hypothetical protein VFM58_06660 [Solirubrobacteraceae bacterium]|nr:hypothetical protein [Solirubrobacteraceae bacterium]